MSSYELERIEDLGKGCSEGCQTLSRCDWLPCLGKLDDDLVEAFKEIYKYAIKSETSYWEFDRTDNGFYLSQDGLQAVTFMCIWVGKHDGTINYSFTLKGRESILEECNLTYNINDVKSFLDKYLAFREKLKTFIKFNIKDIFKCT